MSRANKLPANPHDWSDRHVRSWLKQKGFGHSIQNKFFGERIDGEALLLLTHEDIEGIIQMFPPTEKAKVRYYVDTLIAKTKGTKLPRWKNYETRKRKRRRNMDDSKMRKRRKIKHEPIMQPSQNGGSKRKVTKYSISSNNALPILSKPLRSRRKDQANIDCDDAKSDESEASKIKTYCYSQVNNHDTSNHGARWCKRDLELMWSLYQKGYDLKRLAEHFKRTECGIHVQIYYREKAIKEREDVRNERKRTKKWIKQLKGDSDSSSDDDDLIINQIMRKQKSNTKKSRSTTPSITKSEFHIPSPSPYIFSPDTTSVTSPPQRDMSVEYEEMMKDMFDI